MKHILLVSGVLFLSACGGGGGSSTPTPESAPTSPPQATASIVANPTTVLQGDSVALNSHNCLIKADSRLVAVLGIEGLAVIETKDAVLVAKLDQAQQVKQLVTKLAGRKEISQQREVYRPWGSYDSVDSGPNYQVKRISVNPRSRLSLQRHQFRAEHWVVVQGQAKVHVSGEDHLLNANDSIYIPNGSVHCLANETHEPLYLVEVQSGSYLGEDDIERLDDIYGRN